MAVLQKPLTEKVFKEHMKKYVTKRIFTNYARKNDRRFRDIDENFKSVDRALSTHVNAITRLSLEMREMREEMRRLHAATTAQIDTLVSEVRQDRFETHELRLRVTTLEGKVG